MTLTVELITFLDTAITEFLRAHGIAAKVDFKTYDGTQVQAHIDMSNEGGSEAEGGDGESGND